MTLLGGRVIPVKVKSGEPFNGHPTLINGLLSVFKYSEESGTRFDSYGSNHLTDVNTVGFAAGMHGIAASFVAANLESLSCLTFLGTDTSWTLATWVRFTDTLRHTIFDSGNDGNVYVRAGIDPHGAQAVIKAFTVTASLPAGTITAQNTWYLLIVTYNATTDVLSININAGTPTTASGGPNGAPASFIIGNRTGDVEPMQGQIDETLVYSRALTVQEQADLFAGGLGLHY